MLISFTERYLETVGRLGVLAGADLRALFESYPELRDAALDSWRRDLRPLVEGAYREGAELTRGYLGEVTGSTPQPIDLPGPALGFDDPFLRTWHNLRVGQSFEQARIGGASQAEAIGYDAVQQGVTDRMSSPGVPTKGWRRVVSANACEWCQVVATQLYRSAESARFGHHACRCVVVAVVGPIDATEAINRQRLKALRASGAVRRVSEARTRSRNRGR